MSKEVKLAYKQYKKMKKSKNKKLIHNALCWLIATCEGEKYRLVSK
jgi:hypothetical protein